MTENDRSHHGSKPHPAIKKFVRDIVDGARFDRILNLLQDNGKGCVDEKKYIDIIGLRNLLYWDLYEYLTNSEWGETIAERIKKMKMVKEICPMTGNPHVWSDRTDIKHPFCRDCGRLKCQV